MAGTLYLVATPIGNLQDISARALATLRLVALVACEDTRVTKRLLERYQISVPTVSYHHHSGDGALGRIIERLQNGDSVAYAADAGTPGVSDPGGKLVAAAAALGITVSPIPGPSAVTAVLSVAGFNTQRYTFFGFPPHKKGRQTFFRDVASCEHVAVFYESTHRIVKTIQELERVAPKRALVVGRELTKVFETVYRGTATEVLNKLARTSNKGEFVVVVGSNI